MPRKIYSSCRLPPYAYLPGRQPHPAEDHLALHGLRPQSLSQGDWRNNQHYLHGIDLFNHAYYWECHEALEKIWLMEKHPDTRCFLQGIILGSAALLKRVLDQASSSARLQQSACGKLQGLPGSFYGLDLDQFRSALQSQLLPANDQSFFVTLDLPASSTD